jgi:hypothetical protein
MREVQTFPNGPLLFDHCNKFGFEGVVSKRLASRYSGGPSRNWVKTKCPGWKCINSERYRLFEGPRKPALTEAQKTLARKRQELGRVIERLRSPPLSHGIARGGFQYGGEEDERCCQTGSTRRRGAGRTCWLGLCGGT